MIIIKHSDALGHIVPQGHPERPERWQAVSDMIEADFSHHSFIEAETASHSQLSAVHSEHYLASLFENEPQNQIVAIDGDTFLSPTSLVAASRAAGGACQAVDAVMTGKSETAFVAMRPPGHHAEPDKAMGFCFFSNAAIAAQHARHTYGIENVAVLDFDVHHGNGTQAAFWQEQHCYYASTHEMPLFPGTGAMNETGTGTILNQPLLAGMNGASMQDAWASLLGQLEKAKPELVIISAGFDAHEDDPLANIKLKSEDFYELTAQIMSFAQTTSQGRVVSLMEGGYNIQRLTESVRFHLKALSGKMAE